MCAALRCGWVRVHGAGARPPSWCDPPARVSTRRGSVCRVQGEDGRSAVRRTHRFVLPRRMCGGSGITRECSTSSTAFCTQFRTTSWSFCPSVRPSPLEEEVGLGTREPCKGAAAAITIRPPTRRLPRLAANPGGKCGIVLFITLHPKLPNLMSPKCKTSAKFHPETCTVWQGSCGRIGGGGSLPAT